MPAVQTRRLTKTFGPIVALDGLTLTVEEGEIFGLIGPDGAGKTTTLRLLATVIPPTRGEATVLGHDIVREAESIRRQVGYMPQHFSLYGDLSVWENVNFFADIQGARGLKRRERLEQLLRFARLDQFRDRRARHLSGGMQKKLALICALVHQPRLLLLDEPSTGVDPISRREFWDILADLHVEGVTILVSTPYMDEAERCSRVGLMYEGRLVVCDTPEAIVRRVPGEMVEVLVQPDLDGRLPVRRAQQVVAALPNLIDVQIYGDRLHIFVPEAAPALPAIRQALEAADISFSRVAPALPHMEEAFLYLLRKELGVSSPSQETKLLFGHDGTWGNRQ